MQMFKEMCVFHCLQGYFERRVSKLFYMLVLILVFFYRYSLHGLVYLKGGNGSMGSGPFLKILLVLLQENNRDVSGKSLVL